MGIEIMRLLIFVISVLLILPMVEVFAQNQTAEFIESSSPLPGGGRITSRSAPGNSMQTVVSEPNRAQTDSNSVLESTENPSSPRPLEDHQANDRNFVFRQSNIGFGSNTQGLTPRFTFPQRGRTAFLNQPRQTALFYQPVRATATCSNCNAPYQIPSLGLTNTVQTGRQNYSQANCCGPSFAGTNTVLQVPAAQIPALQIQPPADQVPSLTAPGNNASVFAPAPNPGFGQPNRFLNPFVTGSGAYQPIIRIANVPPGTYLGQGIIGQPVAYVDGQPVRNLLRYVFP